VTKASSFKGEKGEHGQKHIPPRLGKKERRQGEKARALDTLYKVKSGGKKGKGSFPGRGSGRVCKQKSSSSAWGRLS